MLPDVLGSHLRRLVVQKQFIYALSELYVRDDFHTDHFRISTLYVRMMLGICRVIPPTFSSPLL